MATYNWQSHPWIQAAGTTQQSRNPRIERMLASGMGKGAILNALNGPDGMTKVTRNQMTAMGFGSNYINDYMATQATRHGETPRTPGGGGGTGGSTPPPSPGGGSPPGGPLPGQPAVGAFEAFRNFLMTLGIPMGGDIEAIIRKAVVDGYGPQDMYLILPDIQSTATWNNRFPGWQARVNSGYNQLNVAEYLALENNYHRVLQSAGLPAGFYDDPSDFGQWIANNVSVQEIQERVDIAMDMTRRVDPAARDLLTKFYGVTQGDLASYFLDQKRALPALERQYKAVNVAQWAVRNGLSVMGSDHYERLADAGISSEMAMQGYSVVKTFTNTLGQLGDIYGTSYSQLDAENDVFFGDDEKRRRIVANEQSTFSGSSRGQTGTANRGTSY